MNTIYNASFHPSIYKTADGQVVMAPFLAERQRIFLLYYSIISSLFYFVSFCFSSLLLCFTFLIWLAKSWWQEVKAKLLAKGVRMALLPIFLRTSSPDLASWNDTVCFCFIYFYLFCLSICYLLFIYFCLQRYGDTQHGARDGRRHNNNKQPTLHLLTTSPKYLLVSVSFLFFHICFVFSFTSL